MATYLSHRVTVVDAAICARLQARIAREVTAGRLPDVAFPPPRLRIDHRTKTVLLEWQPDALTPDQAQEAAARLWASMEAALSIYAPNAPPVVVGMALGLFAALRADAANVGTEDAMIAAAHHVATTVVRRAQAPKG